MTPDDYAIEFCNSNDVPFATDSKKYRALVRTIAAAVAEEREECAKVADKNVSNNGAMYEESDGAFLASIDIAAAIRARNGSK